MGNNFFTPYSNTAPKTAFTVISLSVPLIDLDQAITYLKNIIVTSDGLVYFVDGTLTWTGDLHIFFNATDGKATHNSVAAGSIALTDNDFAYIDLNEVDDSVITVSDVAITTGAASNFIAFNRLVLGYRNASDDRYYPVYLDAVNAEWDDIVMPIAITHLGVTAPNWTSFFGNLRQYAFDIGEEVEGSFEALHDWVEGSMIEFHLHIVTQGAEASVEARYSMELWIADTGEASTTTATITSDDIPLVNADGHHHVFNIGTVDGTGFKIGAVGCFLLKRVDLVDGSDPSGDPFVISVGVHYMKNSLGSRSEYIK
jgi:hypothetical protein